MSGISGGRGRHAASHAKPGKLSTTKAKVTTTAAVTGALAFTGGVAEAVHVRSGQLHQQALADVPYNGGATILRNAAAGPQANSTGGDQILSQLLQQRGAAAGAVNRDLSRAATPTSKATGLMLNVVTTPTPTSIAPLTPPGTAATLAGITPSGGVPTTSPTSSPSGDGSGDQPATPTPSSGPTTTPTTPKPTPTPAKSSSAAHPAGWNASPAQAKALAQQMVPASQWSCFDDIITRESSWDVHATNPSSGAYGLPQALPGDKMASVSSDWRNNAVTQIKWAINYMDGRYGSPCAAWTFWQAHNWY